MSTTTVVGLPQAAQDTVRLAAELDGLAALAQQAAWDHAHDLEGIRARSVADRVWSAWEHVESARAILAKLLHDGARS